MSVFGQVRKNRDAIVANVFAIRTSQGIIARFCCRYSDSFIDIPYQQGKN